MALSTTPHRLAKISSHSMARRWRYRFIKSCLSGTVQKKMQNLIIIHMDIVQKHNFFFFLFPSLPFAFASLSQVHVGYAGRALRRRHHHR